MNLNNILLKCRNLVVIEYSVLMNLWVCKILNPVVLKEKPLQCLWFPFQITRQIPILHVFHYTFIHFMCNKLHI